MIGVRHLPIFPVLSAFLVGLIILSLWIGDVVLPFSALGPIFTDPSSLYAEVIWGLRLPRSLTAAFVGGMLGMSGAILQGLLRNPLADPGILGVSAGSGLGAALAVVLGFALVPMMSELFSLFGAFSVAICLMIFIRFFPQRHALILVGVGISSLSGALMMLVFNFSPSPIATSEIISWLMGSVENRHWGDVIVCFIITGLAGFGLWRYGQGLRLLSLGEDTAKSLGLDLYRFSQIMVLISISLTAISVAVAGIVGFVGLAAPHLVRAFGMRDPFRLILPSGLSGALMVLGADCLVRIIPVSGDLKLGVLTSLIGAPIFAILAYKSARSWGEEG